MTDEFYGKCSQYDRCFKSAMNMTTPEKRSAIFDIYIGGLCVRGNHFVDTEERWSNKRVSVERDALISKLDIYVRYGILNDSIYDLLVEFIDFCAGVCDDK